MEINIKRIVIWGLRKKYHTHRHIHQAFFKNAKKLGYDVLWVEDEKKNANLIKAGDLIISADPVGRMVPEKFTFEDYNLPVRDDVYYCLHNFKDAYLNKLIENNCKYILLQVYSSLYDKEKDVIINEVSFFNRQNKTLYQPWGTDLLESEFKKPVFNQNKLVFWIGSIWSDKLNRGNINEINELRAALSDFGLKFINLRFIPDWLNIFLVRKSRIAPAIAGKYQTEVNYLPCRVFKNISYGQLGITNVEKFKDILGASFVGGDSIASLIKNSLALTSEEYINMVKAQQLAISKYTYKNAIENIVKAFGY